MGGDDHEHPRDHQVRDDDDMPPWDPELEVQRENEREDEKQGAQLHQVLKEWVIGKRDHEGVVLDQTCRECEC